jgi:putative hemolysin
MKSTRLRGVSRTALMVLLVSACGQATATPLSVQTEEVSELPNPAAVYCEEQGYSYEIREEADGGQYGVCISPEGIECDEWAFYRGECELSVQGESNSLPAYQEQTVTGWSGYVVSAPQGAQYDDILVLLPEGAGQVGLTGASEAIESEIVALRDKPEPGKVAHFWGTLTCGVSDYNGCQLLVTSLRYGMHNTNPEPVEGWEGALVSNPQGMQFDDYFVLAGDFPVAYGIHSLDQELLSRLEGLRDSGAPIRVWGQLRCGVPDAFGSQIDVTRIKE